MSVETGERQWRMINGYREAADLLVAQTELRPYLASNLIYPAIFSYRHSLELHLKYLLGAHGSLAGEAPDFTSHRFKDLWPRCRRLIKLFAQGCEPSALKDLEAVGARIVEFDSVDPNSYSFRFAQNTRGQPIRLQLNTIDLPNLRTIVASLHNFLECADLGMTCRRERANDALEYSCL